VSTATTDTKNSTGGERPPHNIVIKKSSTGARLRKVMKAPPLPLATHTIMSSFKMFSGEGPKSDKESTNQKYN
jgi:hypothetical protein